MSKKKATAKDKLSPDAFIASLRKEFEFISGEVEGILLYGSYARSTADERSDIDICIIKPKTRKVLTRILTKVGGRYDVKIFEDLPLYVKMGVIEKYMIIFGNEPQISYYLYGFRKKWEDMRHRIMNNRFCTVSEMEKTRRKWLDSKRQIPLKV